MLKISLNELLMNTNHSDCYFTKILQPLFTAFAAVMAIKALIWLPWLFKLLSVFGWTADGSVIAFSLIAAFVCFWAGFLNFLFPCVLFLYKYLVSFSLRTWSQGVADDVVCLPNSGKDQ